MNASEFTDHITINLIANASKILERLLWKILENKAKNFIGKHGLDSEKDVKREE